MRPMHSGGIRGDGMDGGMSWRARVIRMEENERRGGGKDRGDGEEESKGEEATF